MFAHEQVAQLRDLEAELEARGFAPVAIGLADAEAAREFRAKAGIAFPLLVDGDLTAHRAFGLRKASLLDLFKPSNAKARRRARGAGHAQTGLGKDPFQLGGTLVVAPGGAVLLAHRSATFGDNLAPDALLAALPAGA